MKYRLPGKRYISFTTLERCERYRTLMMDNVLEYAGGSLYIADLVRVKYRNNSYLIDPVTMEATRLRP